MIEKTLQRLPLFRPGTAKLSTWMFVIARNHALDRFSKRGSAKDPLGGAWPMEVLEWMEWPSSGLSNAGEEPHAYDVSSNESALHEALSTLCEEDRELLRLAFGTTLNAAEIGAQMVLSAGTLRKRKERLLERLRTLINQVEVKGGNRDLAAHAATKDEHNE